LRSFDLVLIDADLTGLGAAELVRRLRGWSSRAASGGPRTDVPILLVGDDTSATTDEAATDLNVDGFLRAPLDLEAVALHLFGIVAAWRHDHPDRPWADATAQAPRDSKMSPRGDQRP